MRKLAGLCLSGLLTSVLFVPQESAAEIVRLDPVVRPVEENVTLTLDANRKDYSGEVAIQLQIAHPASQIRFHASDLVFDDVALRAPDGAQIDTRIERGDEGLVTLSTASELPAGAYSLHIRFHNEFNTKAVGLYRMEYGGQGYLFTQFEAADARRAFPCWDEPGFKIPWQISVKVPAGQIAVGNTGVEKSESADGWTTIHFRQTHPLPSYLIALAVGPLESVPITGLSVPGRIYTVKGQSHLADLAVQVTPGILTALEKYFGTPYPYDKLDLIAVPEFWYGAMENPGAVVFADRVLLVDSSHVSVGQRRVMVGDITHELAHMWFGDLVTMQWWDDLWLNETFASWMADKITHQLYPEFETDLRGRRRASGTMERDARPSTRAIRQPVTDIASLLSDVGLSYQKGRAVMEMIEAWIGPDVFQKGIRSYLKAHSWGNATGADLWDALSEVSGKQLAPVMESYLNQSGFPLIRVTPSGSNVVTVAQQRFLNYGVEAPAQHWVLPIGIRFGDGATGEKTVVLDSASKKVTLNEDVNWILPQGDGIGYYRWVVPDPMLRRLASQSGDLLEPTERVAFIGNAGALLAGGEISGGEYLELLNGFASDPEAEVTTTVLGALNDVKGAFVTDALRPEFASYVRQTLGPVLERIGLEQKAGESAAVSDMRPNLLIWLGYEGKDPEVLGFAHREVDRYFEDPASVDPSIVGVVLRLAALDGDATLFDSYQNRFENATNPADRSRFLSALGAFEKPDLRKRALAYILQGPLRPNELFEVYGGMWGTEADGDQGFDWVRSHYADLQSRIPPEFLSFMPYVAGGCSAERLAKGRKFFSQPEHQGPGTMATLRKVSDQVSDCVRLRQREGESVAHYLAGARGPE